MPGNSENLERRSESRTRIDQYHSVEFSVDGLDIAYQFKIWDIASSSMCLLIKENSDILPRLNVGDTLNMRYYSDDSSLPQGDLATQIRHITKIDEGRLKGHYLVGLEILESMEQNDDFGDQRIL
jgi:hypothetical protein